MTTPLLRFFRVCAALYTLAYGMPLAAQSAEESEEDVEAREEYFWSQRSYPSTERPYALMERARMAASRRMQSLVSSISGAIPGGWRSIGPNGLFDHDPGFFTSGSMIDAGRVTAVAPIPGGNTLFIGSASGGVWRSTGGDYWVPLTDTQCNLTVGAVTMDAADPNVIYAGTGEYNTNSWGCGILRSTDAGASWTLLGANSFRVSRSGVPSGSASFGKILVSRPPGGSVSTTVLIAASNVGVFRSPDGGTTWGPPVLAGATASVVAHPTTAGVVFAGNSDKSTDSRRGVYKSVDNGATWIALPAMPNISVGDIGRIELAVTPAAPNLVYTLLAAVDGNFLGLLAWDDAAGTWRSLSANGLYGGSNRGDFGSQSSYNLVIAVDPRSADRIYIAGVRAYKSIDGGSTFNRFAMDIHADWHSIVIDPQNPDIVYAGTDGGIFVSADQGVTWVSRNSGLTITQYYPGISASPNASAIMGGSQDNGTHHYTGSLYWNGFFSGDGGYTAINYANPSVRYGETQWAGGSFTFIRQEGAASSSRTLGINRNDRAAFIPPFVMDPVAPTTLYFGTNRLYRTTNEGSQWTSISTDLTKGSGFITTIAVAKSDPLTIYVGTSDGNVNVTRDGGATFTLRTTGLPDRWVTRVHIDPLDATHALLTVSSFGTGHVFETKDAGVSWTDISAGLADAPANAVVFVPSVGIMVGTDVGVFQAPSPGAPWVAGPVGIPNVIVNDLIYVPGANLLLAGTYGRGMFAYTVGGQTPVLRGDVNADGTVDAFDALLIQQSLVGTLPGSTMIYPRGDADCNETIQTADAVHVLRTAVGLTSTVCVNTVR